MNNWIYICTRLSFSTFGDNLGRIVLCRGRFTRLHMRHKTADVLCIMIPPKSLTLTIRPSSRSCLGQASIDYYQHCYFLIFIREKNEFSFQISIFAVSIHNFLYFVYFKFQFLLCQFVVKKDHTGRQIKLWEYFRISFCSSCCT